ncbi:unnamed protein product [Phytomonas sp. EM1]|nr:unnamed protein product [Phytomonas sp. EM1]|eukprot:CCW62207.1 unnamed protein product [Phytomonas sp. isolate EM1]
MQKDSPYLSVSKVSTKNRSPKRQRRCCLFIVALFVFWILLISCVTIALFSLQHLDTQENTKHNAIEGMASEELELRWRNAVIDVLSSAKVMKGFIIGEIKSLPPLNGSKSERMAGQTFPRFGNVANLINSTLATSPEMISAPGGVICQTSPDIPGMVGFDLLNYNDSGNVPNWISPYKTIETGEDDLIGPYVSGIPSGSFLNDFIIHVRVPIYNLTTLNSSDLVKSFWGFLYLTLSVNNILVECGLHKYVEDTNIEYLTYTTTPNGYSVIPIETNLLGKKTQEELIYFISKSIVTAILPQKLSWFLAVRSRSRKNYFNSVSIALTLCISSFCALILLCFAILIILHCTREYDERKHAPKAAPFAVLTLGFCYGDSLWNLASDEMVRITEKLTSVACKVKEQTQGCSIPQLQPHVNSYIFQGVDDAVRMALGVMSELQRRPIDKPMQRLFGEEGQLLLAYAVHWCVDASVRPSPYAGGGYLYEGPDVVYGGRMWIFAVPNVITLSEPATEALKRTNPALHSQIQFFNSVYIRGVKKRQNLFTLEDHNATKMNKSLTKVVWQLRYMGRTPQYHPRGSYTETNANQLDMSLGLINIHVPHDAHDNTGTNLEDHVNLLGNESMHSTISLNSSGNISSIGGDLALRVTDPGSHTHTSLNSPGKQQTTAGGMGGTDVCSVNTGLNAAIFASNEAQLAVMNQFRNRSPPQVGANQCYPSESHRNGFSGTVNRLCGPVDIRQLPTCLPAQGSIQSKRTSPLHNLGDLTTSMTKQRSSDGQISSDISYGGIVDMKKCHPTSSKGSQISSCKKLVARRPHCKDGSYKNSVDEAELSCSTTFPHPRLAAFTDLLNKNTTEKSSSSEALISKHFRGTPTQPHLINVPLNPFLVAEVLTGTGHEGELNECSSRSSSPGSSNSANNHNGIYQRWVSSSDALRFNVSGPLGMRGNLNESSFQIKSNTNPTPTCSLASSSIQHPPIQDSLDAALRTAFEHQAVALDISYESVRVLMYFFFQSLRILFKPLMKAEKINVFERLAAALGISQQGTLENLAARCVIQYMQQHERELTLWWDQMLKKQEEMEQ